jgi:hypothetical protein
MMHRKAKKPAESPKMLALNIGENDPVGNKLVSLEMGKVATMKFKKPKEARKESIRRIFGKMVQVDADNDVAAAKAAELTSAKSTRKSMAADSACGLELESSETGTPVLISMKSATPRKASFTPQVRVPTMSETE